MSRVLKAKKGKITTSSNETISVFVLQEIAKSEKEARTILKDAKTGADCLGGRVYPPAKARLKRWVVHTYYVDDGGKPPQGMARLTVRADSDIVQISGIKKAS